jgi:protein-S-isoprenylcysteine O-methyltransferase Ste14
MGDSLKLWIFRYRGILPVPFLAIAVLTSSTSPFASAFHVALDGLGIGLAAAGLGLRGWAVGHAGAHTRSYRLRARRLATGGPYAWVRNPIYLGNFLVGLGVTMVAQSWATFLVFLVGFAVEYGAIVSLEERFLADTFGDVYGEYRRRVPRWLPRLATAPAAAGGAFCWRAIRKEYQALMSALGMVSTVELVEWLRFLARGSPAIGRRSGTCTRCDSARWGGSCPGRPRPAAERGLAGRRDRLRWTREWPARPRRPPPAPPARGPGRGSAPLLCHRVFQGLPPGES